MNRAMGLQDLYPFVLSPAVIHKLGFIHDLVHGRVGTAARQPEGDVDSRKEAASRQASAA